jgi:hypothetical protein
MKSKFRKRTLIAACAFMIGIGASWSAFARPCCSHCDPNDPDSFCWAICDFGC